MLSIIKEVRDGCSKPDRKRKTDRLLKQGREIWIMNYLKNRS